MSTESGMPLKAEPNSDYDEQTEPISLTVTSARVKNEEPAMGYDLSMQPSNSNISRQSDFAAPISMDTTEPVPSTSSSATAGIAGPLQVSMSIPKCEPECEIQDDDLDDDDEDEEIDDDESDDLSSEPDDGIIGAQRSPVSDCKAYPSAEFPEEMQLHVKQITEKIKKLRVKVTAQHRQIRLLRAENKAKTKNIDQIKDLNIRLQIELERFRAAASKHASLPMSPDSDGRVTFSHGITLTAYNLKDLECCEIGEKGDSSFILKLLLALYSREDLRLKSITGKPSRNKKYVQDKGEKFTPEKLQFIKDKFRERVYNEQTLPTELEKRCRDERVHKIINTKIQNLKRKRLNF